MMSNADAPKVSVLVVSYNHEKYIRQALDSVAMQETDFDFEVVVADDHSQDSTLLIIEEYRDRLSNLRILPSERNLGITRNYQRGFAACRGHYIAVIEGDDFWTSPAKLKTQVSFLHEHRECAFVFHRFLRHEEGSGRFTPFPGFEFTSDFELFTAADLARDNFIGNFSACMYRREVVTKIDPGLFEMEVYDWMFNIVAAQQAMIGYLPKALSVYRLHALGKWSARTKEEKLLGTLKLIEVYDKYLDFRFAEEFEACKAILRFNLAPQEPAEPIEKSRSRSFIAAITPPILISGLKWLLAKIRK